MLVGKERTDTSHNNINHKEVQCFQDCTDNIFKICTIKCEIKVVLSINSLINEPIVDLNSLESNQ